MKQPVGTPPSAEGSTGADHSAFLDFISKMHADDQKLAIGLYSVLVCVLSRLGDFVIFVPSKGSIGDGILSLLRSGPYGVPAPWKDFVYPPYRLPESPSDADQRIKRNLELFAPNYLSLLAVAWATFLLRKPSAALTIGLFALWRFVPRKLVNFQVPFVNWSFTLTEAAGTWIGRGALVASAILGLFSGSISRAIQSVVVTRS